jgi:hypothetical protein
MKINKVKIDKLREDFKFKPRTYKEALRDKMGGRKRKI